MAMIRSFAQCLSVSLCLVGALCMTAGIPTVAHAKCNPGRTDDKIDHQDGWSNSNVTIGGVYSDILNYSPYVANEIINGNAEYVSAWSMIKHYETCSWAQVG